jgi:hypothetical protein
MTVRASVLAALLGLGGIARAEAPALPEDGRIDPVRGTLAEAVARASAAGLPADLLVSKVREGLAKGVDPARIQAAVARFHQALASAQALVTQRRPGAAAPVLVRAVAEAQIAGVPVETTGPLVAAGRTPQEAARAVEVLTDLALRGYPPARSTPLVRDVLAREPAALPRLARALEAVRTELALTQAEAIDGLARGVSAADSLDSGLARTMDEERRRGPSAGKAKSGRAERGPPGRTGVLPGHLPKLKPPGHPRKP